VVGAVLWGGVALTDAVHRSLHTPATTIALAVVTVCDVMGDALFIGLDLANETTRSLRMYMMLAAVVMGVTLAIDACILVRVPILPSSHRRSQGEGTSMYCMRSAGSILNVCSGTDTRIAFVYRCRRTGVGL